MDKGRECKYKHLLKSLEKTDSLTKMPFMVLRPSQLWSGHYRDTDRGLQTDVCSHGTLSLKLCSLFPVAQKHCSYPVHIAMLKGDLAAEFLLEYEGF